MKCNRGALIWVLTFGILFVSAQSLLSQPDEQPSRQQDDDEPVNAAHLHNPVLWRDPGAIAELDLLHGQGGKSGQPEPPFKFEQENQHGTNPKFDVRDAQGTEWRVKLGDEARPEVTASRLLWAVGYFVDDDYLLESASVEN